MQTKLEEVLKSLEGAVRRGVGALSEGFAEVFVGGADPGEGAGQRIPPRTGRDETHRERFENMRRIARRTGFGGVPYEGLRERIFYEQARFMEDFEDDYGGFAPFSVYYPSYQMMGYEQLRTYFTWRSRVRRGEFPEISLSYICVHVYEILNNVGVSSPEEGLERLVVLWEAYRRLDRAVDRYLSRWIADYYIVGDFALSPAEMLEKFPSLRRLYTLPEGPGPFERYYKYSDYKLKNSIYFSVENASRIEACFDHMVGYVNDFLKPFGAELDDFIFYQSHGSVWRPFKSAVYYPDSRPGGRDRTVVISETEKYRFEKGRWSYSGDRVCVSNGRLILGYLYRRVEQFWRKADGFRHRLSAETKQISAADIERRLPDAKEFFAAADRGIYDFYREINKKVVAVDENRLEKIRENALKIQERLTAAPGEGADPEELPLNAGIPLNAELPLDAEIPESAARGPDLAESAPAAEIPKPPDIPGPAPAADGEKLPGEGTKPQKMPAVPPETLSPWRRFGAALDEAETALLRAALCNAEPREIREIARKSGTMLEVMADCVNQKAIEHNGDGILELGEGISVYEEYREELERVILN